MLNTADKCNIMFSRQVWQCFIYWLCSLCYYIAWWSLIFSCTAVLGINCYKVRLCFKSAQLCSTDVAITCPLLIHVFTHTPANKFTMNEKFVFVKADPLYSLKGGGSGGFCKKINNNKAHSIKSNIFLNFPFCGGIKHDWWFSEKKNHWCIGKKLFYRYQFSTSSPQIYNGLALIMWQWSIDAWSVPIWTVKYSVFVTVVPKCIDVWSVPRWTVKNYLLRWSLSVFIFDLCQDGQ